MLTFLSDIRDIIHDACVDDSDGFARSRRISLLNGYLSTFASSITTGTFFTVLMLAIGADDAYFGYVTMITTLSAVIQLFSPILWEHIPIRKPLLVTCSVVSNLLTYGVVTCIPFLPCESQTKLLLYLLVSLITSVINGFTSPASGAWSIQFIPAEKRVNFSSVTSLGQTVINIVSTFLAGVLLDLFEEKEIGIGTISPALSAILIFRLAAAAVSVWTIVNVVRFLKETPSETTASASLKDNLLLLVQPLRNGPFLLSILIPCLWTMCSSIIGNFFNLQLVENVKMSYTLISSASFFNTPLILLVTPLWTVILKKRPWVRCLSLAYVGYCCAWLCNVFISAETQIFYFICIIVGNLFQPCINLVSGNLMYFFLPPKDRTAYLSFYALVSNLFAFLGTTIGTVFVKYTGDLQWTLFGVSVCNLQLTSGIAAVLGLGVAGYTLWFSRYSKGKINHHTEERHERQEDPK